MEQYPQLAFRVVIVIEAKANGPHGAVVDQSGRSGKENFIERTVQDGFLVLPFHNCLQGLEQVPFQAEIQFVP